MNAFIIFNNFIGYSTVIIGYSTVIIGYSTVIIGYSTVIIGYMVKVFIINYIYNYWYNFIIYFVNVIIIIKFMCIKITLFIITTTFI